MSKKVIISSLWSITSRFSLIILEFITQIILARILFPEDFGLIALVMVFVAFGRALTRSGLEQALIQKKEVKLIEECSVFYFNILVGFVFTLIVFFSSKLVANYYNEPDLENILKVVSFWFIINSLSIIQDAKLTKELKFKSKFQANIVPATVSSIVSVSLALLGYGVWALVVQIMLTQVLRTIALWKLSAWRPKLIFSWIRLKSLLIFGVNILVSSLLTGFRINIFSIIIGKSYSTAQLGFYSRANQLQNITSKTFTTSIQNVLFPVFSNLQDDKILLRNGLKMSIKSLFLIITPLMVFFIVNAEELIIALLTEKWIESASYLKILCLLGIIYPLQMMNFNVIKAIGLSKKFLFATLFLDVLSILSALLTASYGINVMIIGQIVVSLISLIVVVLTNGNNYNYKLKSQIKDLAPLIVLNLLFYLIIDNFFDTIFDGINLYIHLLLKGIVCLIIYVLLFFIVDNSFCNEILNEYRKNFKNKRK